MQCKTDKMEHKHLVALYLFMLVIVLLSVLAQHFCVVKYVLLKFNHFLLPMFCVENGFGNRDLMNLMSVKKGIYIFNLQEFAISFYIST